MSKQTAQYFAEYYVKNRDTIIRKRSEYRKYHLFRLVAAARGYVAKYRAKNHTAILAKTKDPEYRKRKNAKSAKHYSENAIRIRRKHAEYYKNNRLKISMASKDYYSKNKALISEKASIRWKQNPNKTAAYKQVVEYRRQNIQCRIATNLRTRVWYALKKGEKSKAFPTVKLLGCTIAELIEHLESKFTEGMSWENYGKWHVDHIEPCAVFDLSNPDEQHKCFHYLNLQPLWAADNLRKSDQYRLTRA